ncbi:hypothetical protein GCM10025864_40810 [Luteimicrobium album]|uniref:Uncharacterized protein n=1 Tax=Luteimicrobium album TaxID=1054550 RepID=A0ABQ6I6Q7_9MICO|nr:hypothetical protein GCM10025864_40810 [Luteimicrobium album]
MHDLRGQRVAELGGERRLARSGRAVHDDEPRPVPRGPRRGSPSRVRLTSSARTAGDTLMRVPPASCVATGSVLRPHPVLRRAGAGGVELLGDPGRGRAADGVA